MNFHTVSLISLGVFLVAATPSEARTSESYSGSYLASRSAGRAHDLQATSDFTQAALRGDAGNSVLGDRLFQTRLMMGDISGAEGLAANVIKTNSQHRMARLVLGLKEFRARRYGEARENFDEAAYTPVGELTSALLSAWAYAGEGSLNAAVQQLEKLNGQDAFANYQAFHGALIADYLGSSIRAEASYKKAYELAPTSLRIVQAYGNFLLRNGRKDEAEKIYRAYLADGQSDVLVQRDLADAMSGAKPQPFVTTPMGGAGEALFSLAAALNGDQNADSALMYGQLAGAVGADKPVILTTIGGTQSDLKLYEEANATFEKIGKDSVLRNYADMQIALNLHRLENSKDAIARLQAVVARDPKYVDALVTLGSLYRATEDLSKATEVYTRAIDLLPAGDTGNWRIFYDRGIAFERQKQFDKSEADFRKALKMSNDDPSVLNYLGYSMIDRGVKLDEALAMVKKAVDLKPNDGYIVDSLGWAYYTLRDYDQAVGYLERAVDLMPGDPTIAEHLGDAYWRQGRKLEAQFQWQHAKDNKPEAAELARVEGKLKNGMAEKPETKPAENSNATKPSNG